MNSSDTDNVVLDSSALMAFLQDEPGSEAVERVLDGAAISTVNLAEVLTTALQKRGDAPVILRSRLNSLGLRVLEFTPDDAAETAYLWPRTKRQGLSLGDRACLALGKRLNARVLTAERQPDWRKLGLDGVVIEIIR